MVIEPVGGHGGMAPYDVNLCNGIADAGIDIALVTCPETHPPVVPRFDLRLSYSGVFGQDSGWIRGMRFLRTSLSMIGRCVAEGRKICHFHFFKVGPLEFFNVFLAKVLARKVVVTAHDVESFYSGLDYGVLPKLAYRMADAIIAHNQVSYQALVEGRGLQASRVHVIPAGNHLSSLPDSPSQDDARSHLGLPQDAPVLLFFGQIKDVKGLDILLEAMPIVIRAFPEVRLIIAGRPMRVTFGRYEEMIERLGIQDHCVLRIGYIPDDDLPLYYQACDLVTLPYRRIYQSDVLLMAMSYGKAVLTSDIPGMTEMISDCKTGFLFRCGDPQDLARAINLALTNSSLRNNVACHGLQLMQESYNWASIGKTIAKLYQSL